jgi:glycosyltransferase involved in cell wall biosynthesis
MKIAIVGPTHPFKGGISHYTTILSNELKKNHQVTFYSFSRPYPSWFFPGSTREDSSKYKITTNNVKYIIDWLNPFTWIKVGSKICFDKPQKLILPWWMWGWSIPFWIIIKITKLNKETQVIYICHNVTEHESHFWKKFLTKFALKAGDKFIVHSKIEKKRLSLFIDSQKIYKTNHPTYNIFKKSILTKKEAKKELNIKFKNTLLFFGYIRPYKGLKKLLKVLADVVKIKPDIGLIIAGEFWENKEDYLELIDKLKLNSNVKIFDEYIKNERVQYFFEAADVVVLPYLSATGSGISQIAIAFNKKIIASNVGDFKEILAKYKKGVVFKNNEDLKNILLKTYQNKTNYTKKFGWKNLIKFITH